ncbi:MAG: class I SAM-dependent methyltransferase [Caldilineaceae bacterium]
MNKVTQQCLLDLNRQFYATVADDFDSTRLNLPMGMIRALNYVRPLLVEGENLSVLDAGCGNGRFCWALEKLEAPIDYLGIDNDQRLLDLAQTHSSQLHFVDAQFRQLDLVTLSHPNQGRLHLITLALCHLITCFAVLHHIPSFNLRLQLVRWLASQLKPGGRLLISTWQFLNSPRLVAKQIDWSVVGIEPEETEPGDALLPWNQGVYAIRYAHQIDEDEMRELAQEAGLLLQEIYYADGKEGNLNLYAVLEIGKSASDAG